MFEVLLVGAIGCALAAGAFLRVLDGERRVVLMSHSQNERDSLARKLHDNLSNHLAGMILMVQSTRRTIDSPTADVPAQLQRIEEAGDAALSAVRQWVTDLRRMHVENDDELAEDRNADMMSVLTRWKASHPDRLLEANMPGERDLHGRSAAALHRVLQEDAGVPWAFIFLRKEPV